MINPLVLILVFVLIIGAMIRGDQIRHKNRQRRFDQDVVDRYNKRGKR